MDYSGVFILLVGPSGAGKSYLENKFLERNSDLKKLVSFTTREKRPGEIDGIDYHFINKEDMKDLNILQQMEIYNNYYGTCKEHLMPDYNHILVVGVDGPKQFKNMFGEEKVVTVFVYSPWYRRLYRLIKRDGLKRGLNRFISDVGRFKDFDKSETIVLNN